MHTHTHTHKHTIFNFQTYTQCNTFFFILFVHSHQLYVITTPLSADQVPRYRIRVTTSLHYDPANPPEFSTLQKLQAAVKRKPAGHITAWLQNQDVYMLHRPVGKRFASSPHSVNNVMDVQECDPVDIQTLSTFNDNYNYILSVIDVFQISTSGPSKVQHRGRCSVGVSVEIQWPEIFQT